MYSGAHERVRRAFLAAFCAGQPCALGGEPLYGPARLLDLAHATDDQGVPLVPPRWLGLSCRKHNRGANSWGRLGKGTDRTPERAAEVKVVESRREAKRARAEFDCVQAEIAAGRDF